MTGQIGPFEAHVPQAELDDLRERLARTRWIDEFPDRDWSYGTSRQYLQVLCAYWRDGFDWRACEARLNTFGQVAMDVDGQRIHAVHARSGRFPTPRLSASSSGLSAQPIQRHLHIDTRPPRR